MSSITVLTPDWFTHNPGGGAALPAGLPVILRPNSEGTWTGVLTQRTPGVIYWWHRPLNPSVNAPIPQYVDGYADGDIVSPVTGNERLPYRGIVFSESGITTIDGNPPLTGRTADNYAGGVEQAVWGMIAGEGDQARARIISGTDEGIELYDTPTVYVASPDLDWSFPFRVAMDVKVVAASSYVGGIIIAGETPQQRAVVVQVSSTSTPGEYAWTIQHIGPDNWADPVTLGTATGPDWERATIAVNGNTVTVTHAGSTFTHTLTGEAAALPQRFALWSKRWGLLRVRNITVEAV